MPLTYHRHPLAPSHPAEATVLFAHGWCSIFVGGIRTFLVFRNLKVGRLGYSEDLKGSNDRLCVDLASLRMITQCHLAYIYTVSALSSRCSSAVDDLTVRWINLPSIASRLPFLITPFPQ